MTALLQGAVLVVYTNVYFPCLTGLTEKWEHGIMNTERKEEITKSTDIHTPEKQNLLSEVTVIALVNLGDVLRRINTRLRREGNPIDIDKAIKDHENGDCQN
jgi:hypothetical protein